MNITDLFENGSYDDEAEHFDALDKTGFYGAAGAGCVFLAKSTGRLLLCHRSAYVEQPGTWGGWGGAINRGENPEEAVRREAFEETGKSGPFDLIPLLVFSSGTFRYYNYLVVVDEEFAPTIDWESQGHKWVELGQWPKPLHFGLESLFSDPASVKTIKDAVASFKK